MKTGTESLSSTKDSKRLANNRVVGIRRPLRDRALIGVMVYSFARVGAVVGMNVEAYVDAYLAAAQIAQDRKGPPFRSLDRERHLTERRLHRLEVLATPAPTCGVCRRGVIKRRARQAGLPHTTCCHTFRATGITT